MNVKSYVGITRLQKYMVSTKIIGINVPTKFYLLLLMYWKNIVHVNFYYLIKVKFSDPGLNYNECMYD